MTDEKTTAGAVTPVPTKREFVRHRAHTLLVPIPRSSDGTEVKDVVMRRPKGKEIREIEKRTDEDGAIVATYHMIASLTGLTFEDVDKMDGEDVMILSEMVTDFLPKQKTGET